MCYLGNILGCFSHYIAEQWSLDTNPSLLRLNTVMVLISVMDGSQLVHFLFSPMYNSSGRIKTANGPQCAVQLCSVTADLQSNYFRKKQLLSWISHSLIIRKVKQHKWIEKCSFLSQWIVKYIRLNHAGGGFHFFHWAVFTEMTAYWHKMSAEDALLFQTKVHKNVQRK